MGDELVYVKLHNLEKDKCNIYQENLIEKGRRCFKKS